MRHVTFKNACIISGLSTVALCACRLTGEAWGAGVMMFMFWCAYALDKGFNWSDEE